MLHFREGFGDSDSAWKQQLARQRCLQLCLWINTRAFVGKKLSERKLVGEIYLQSCLGCCFAAPSIKQFCASVLYDLRKAD